MAKKGFTPEQEAAKLGQIAAAIWNFSCQSAPRVLCEESQSAHAH